MGHGQAWGECNTYDDRAPFTYTFKYDNDHYRGISVYAMNYDSFQENMYKMVHKHDMQISTISRHLNLHGTSSPVDVRRRLPASNPPPSVQATFSRCEVLLILVAGLNLLVLYYLTRDRRSAKQRHSSRDSTWSAVVNR